MPNIDEATVDELWRASLIRCEHIGPGSTLIHPLSDGRAMAEDCGRNESDVPAADLSQLLAAVDAQADSASRLAWPAVRPVLVALRDYWEAAGFSAHGIQLRPILTARPGARDVPSATARPLVAQLDRASRAGGPNSC
jgi:hypothetical protein